VLLLCGWVFLLNANTLRAFFVGDDFEILFEVLKAQSLGQALRVTFMDNWGPLSYGQFWLNHRIGGFDPLVYHATNLAWHALLVVGLFGLMRTVWPAERWAAWAAALLFAAHPANDQAVANISGRSHVIAVALAVAALGLYARSRLDGRSAARSTVLLAAALAAAFLAGLSKESTMTLPAWVVALEWAVIRPARGGSAGRTLVRAGGMALLFALAAVARFPARWLVVPGESPKVFGISINDEDFLVSHFSGYTLLGGLPLPFAWADLPQLERFELLGWIVAGAALAAGAACLWLVTFRPAGAGRAAGLWVTGLTVAVTTLLPVAYADLQFQRRYTFIGNVGTVLMAVAALHGIRSRFPRSGRILLAGLVLAGAIGTVQRNELYRRAGQISRNVIETTFERPIAALPRPHGSPRPRLTYVTMPRHYGGDRASGAILLHHTDLRAALWLFGRARPDLNITLRCPHADDYSASVEFETDTGLFLTVRFRSRAAFLAAQERDPEGDRLRDYAAARLLSADPVTLTLRYRLRLIEAFWKERRELYLYSDERFSRLHPPRGVR
jgi:hypothetical protein